VVLRCDKGIYIAFTPDGTQKSFLVHNALPSPDSALKQCTHTKANMGFNLHAAGTTDPKEVRNWKIHLIAITASMSAIASMASSP